MSFNPSLIALSIASLRRRALKNLSLLIALVIVIFTASSILFTADSIQRVNKEQIGRLPDITMQRMVGGRLETIEEGRVDELLEIEGVEWAIGRIWGYYFFPHAGLQNGGANFTLLGIDPYYGSEENHRLPEEFLEILPQESGVMHVGLGVKRAMEKSFSPSSLAFVSPGGELWRLKLGLVLEEVGLYDFILLPKEEARAILGMEEGRVTDIVLKVSNPKEVATIASKLIERYPDSKILTKEQITLAYESLIGYKSGLFLALFITVFLAIGIVIYEKASGISEEERREISLQKAIGWSVGEVMTLKFLEHGWLILLALFLGLLGAYFFVYGLGSPYLSQIFISSSDLALPFSPRLGAGFFEILTYGLFGAFLYLSAVMIPVWRSAMSDAGEVIR
ncbi:ABC transporter permease [Wolinella succinogenes]|uniref:ABC3 transporter permease C-terminal domain-containing protein n=1 Tax=Wolinella succinogenes (strain ATCC 29543 / DSM 1740 / CCUG 13145 / JCM 31913 / LMG 7466 / NCTC 11488 / FDC 602W) TaxID=273121 RepID=Q7MSA2_WOLSU|nr:FtsX-like permease family protein [Wolinella succinogenes]CAE09768.1 hypothetical protein WS0637 [Wolinella succinogenes]VEG81983.1 FtsX-like permease family [Wolinella succinogenes]HCZ19388.1 ABC transporter permease [Helicobacter sp.]